MEMTVDAFCVKDISRILEMSKNFAPDYLGGESDEIDALFERPGKHASAHA